MTSAVPVTESPETKWRRIFDLGVFLVMALLGWILKGREKESSESTPVPSMSLTVIVPAHNEEEGLPATLEALLNQTEPADAIIVVDDSSKDRTREVAESYPGVIVVTTPEATGSKAGAQNYALPLCKTDLVLPVDADTVLAPDYIELAKKPLADDDKVVISAGCVQTRFDNTVTEKGRLIEYLFGFHWHRPIQNAASSPVVCSGCCSVFRRKELAEFGGFPMRTVVEDMDYTWTQQIAGRQAVYVSDAVAYAADPENLTYLRKQVWRWMAGFFQNVRIHYRELLKVKKMLALWVTLAVLEILTVPLWYSLPFINTFVFHIPVGMTMLWWLGIDIALMLPVLGYASWRRKISFWRVLKAVPCVYVNRVVNNYYALKALVVELILVPMKLSEGLVVYEKGRA